MASELFCYRSTFGYKQINMERKKFNPVAWFEIYIEDMERAVKFYETVLNVKLEDMDTPEGVSMQMKCFPGSEDGLGASGALVKMDGMKCGGNSTLVYFGCEDCAVEQSRVVAAGGAIHQPKFSIGSYGFCAIIADTEGNAIGLYSMK